MLMFLVVTQLTLLVCKPLLKHIAGSASYKSNGAPTHALDMQECSSR